MEKFKYAKKMYVNITFSLLNFPRAAILNIYDVLRLLNCCIQKNVDSWQQRQPYDVINIPNGGAQKNFHAKIGDIHFFCSLKVYFHLFVR